MVFMGWWVSAFAPFTSPKFRVPVENLWGGVSVLNLCPVPYSRGDRCEPTHDLLPTDFHLADDLLRQLFHGAHLTGGNTLATLGNEIAPLDKEEGQLALGHKAILQ